MIAIKDTEMPRNCLECDFENNNLMCDLLHWKIGDTEKTRLDGRLPDCPLIEVDDPTPRRVQAYSRFMDFILAENEPTMEEFMSGQDRGDPEDGRL